MKKIICTLLSMVMVLLVLAQPSVGLAESPTSADAYVSTEQASIDGRVKVENGQLIVPGGPDVTCYTHQTFSGNYTIEMKATVHHQAVGLLFGSGSPNPPLWILALVEPYGMWAHMPGNWSTINKAPSSAVKADTPVTMKININGTTVTTYLNGNLVNSCSLSEASTSGPLGLRFSSSESGDIDYIKVSQDGQVIWIDDFNSLDGDKWDFPVEVYDNLINDMEPIWEGATAYNEFVWPIAELSGSVKDISLLYKADEILSVKNSELNITYTAGVDYSLTDGKLRIPSGSKIPVTSYTTYHPSSGSFGDKNGGYLYWPGETPEIIKSQICVTYKHSDSWTSDKPKDKSSLLPKTFSKLKNNQNVSIVFYGDSITEGFNTSGKMGISPFMPNWSNLVTKSMQKAYPRASINPTNTGLAGKDTVWGINNIETRVNAYNPDIVVLAFGMNDGYSLPASDYIKNINSMISAIKAKNADCEIVLVSSMLPNPDYANVGNHAAYRPELLKLEKPGIAVADITSLHSNLLIKKRFSDMTGNNINHPNDYLARVYAQTVYQTILGNNKQAPLTDINYVKGSNLSAQTLDIELPTSGKGPYPVVMFIHGGAWVIGEKETDEARGGLDAALGAGYAVVSINYRLAQNAKWPAQIYDCKAAVRYIRAHAETYNLDPDNIAVWGASAGAHLAQMVGVTNDKPDFEDLTMGNSDFSSDVQSVVSIYGISDLTTWNEPDWIKTITTTGKDSRTTLLGDNYSKQKALEASSITHISKDTVPMFIAHGMNDNVVNPDESTILAEKLKSTIGFYKVDTFFPPVGQHADVAYWNSSEPVKRILNFLQKQFKPTVNLDSPENKRPEYWNVDLSEYKNKHLNLTYANVSPTQKLHIVLPDTGKGPYPLIIFVHGGGFSGGNSSGSSVLYTTEGALQALNKGYAVAMVDYRTSSEAHFPQPIYDVKAAIRFLRASSEQYSLDPSKFAIWGESAGGLIADFIGTTNNNPKYEDLSMGNPEASSAVQAVVSFYAITDMTTAQNAQYCQAWLGTSGTSDINLTKEASPINHVNSDAPPFYIQHGMSDTEVAYSDSFILYNKLKTSTNDENTKLELFPGLEHAVQLFISEPNVDQISSWLDTVLVTPETSKLGNVLVSALELDLKNYISQYKSGFLNAVTKAQSLLEQEYPLARSVDQATSTLEATIASLRLIADLNADDAITVTDVVNLRSIIMGDTTADEVQFEAGDINKDGQLTVTDIVALRRIIMND